MLRHKKTLLFILLVSVLSLCACSKDDKISITKLSGSNTDKVMQCDSYYLSANDIRLLRLSIMEGYEDILTSNIWDVDVAGIKFSDAVNDSIKEMASRLLIVTMLAEDKGIYLTTDEKKQAEQKADEYYLSKADKLSFITKDEVRRLFNMLTLSDKTYEELTANISKEVSVDEARIVKFMYIYSKDSRQRIMDAYEDLLAGYEFVVVAGKYSDSEEYIAEIGRGDTLPEFEEVVFSLDTGMTSDIISCDGSFYIVKIINDNVEDKALGQKQLIIQNRCKKQFDEFFNGFAGDIKIEFNEKLWNELLD